MRPLRVLDRVILGTILVSALLLAGAFIFRAEAPQERQPDTLRCQGGDLVRYAPGEPVVMEEPGSELCEEKQ